MSSKKNTPSHVILLVHILVIMSCLLSNSYSDPRISQAGLYCGEHKAPPKSNYIPSFIQEMENLSQLVTNHNWGTHFVNISGSVPIYGFAQCFKDLSHTDCLLCYAASRTKLPRCLPSISARIYLDGCFLRYDNYSFYSEETDPLRDSVSCTSTSERLEVQMEKSIEKVIDVVAGDAVNGGGGFAKKEIEGVYALAQCWNTLGIQGCKDCLKNAVRKVRGCLPNKEGRALNAGCYLRYSTRNFFNEGVKDGGNESLSKGDVIAAVLATAAIILLALSASFAVFKKLSNLKKENSRTQILNWKQRFNIIRGTAEGLAYLHQGTKKRIIHRDIKSSNILLDDNLFPKIADFGLARCFAADKTHLSTGIAGTLGYMAPEYVIRGQLTDKADVYSFGVLVLEIVTGRRNNVIREDSGSLLQTVWKLYRSNTLVESVDSSVGDDFPEAEASRVFHIGLLCTQASASLRPSMDQVVEMLRNSELDVPTPNQPPFMNTAMVDSDSSIRSYSTNSSVSNALKKIGVSHSYSESSSDEPSKNEEPTVQT